jgi:hypothetical protein
MSLAQTCDARDLTLQLLDPGSETLVRLFRHPHGEWAAPPEAFRTLRVDPPLGHQADYAVLYTGDYLPAVAAECGVVIAGEGDHTTWRSDKAATYQVAPYAFTKPALFLPIDGDNRRRLGLTGKQRRESRHRGDRWCRSLRCRALCRVRPHARRICRSSGGLTA